MPNVSQAQRAAMAAAAAGKSTLGIPRKVGAEFMAADQGGRLPARIGLAQLAEAHQARQQRQLMEPRVPSVTTKR